MRFTEKYSPLTFNWLGQFRNTGTQLGSAITGASSSNTFYLNYTFPTKGIMHFQYRVSSETNYDKFTILFNGVTQATISGSVGWKTWEKEVPEGTHQILFRYSKDASVNSGEDAGFITDFWVEHDTVEIKQYNLTPSFFHKEDVNVEFTLESADPRYTNAHYKIYTAEGVQLYPTSGYSPTVKLPFTAKHSFSASNFKVGTTNTVHVEAKEPTTPSSMAAVKSNTNRRRNSPPTAKAVATPPKVHKEHSMLSLDIDDSDKDAVQFRVRLNGKQIIPTSGTYTELIKTPFSYTVPIRNVDLVSGDNTVNIILLDDLGGSSSTNIIITKENDAVVIVQAEVKGQTLYARLTDPDGDMVKYQVLLNKVKIYPPDEDMTGLLTSPAYVNYKIPPEHIDFGNVHRVEIVAEDDVGLRTTWAGNALLDYAGLLFTDELDAYYSTDAGDIIKLLDTGSTVAGETSGTFKVYLKNTVGYGVENIKLKAIQRDLDPVTEKVEISLLESPFTSQEVLDVGRLDYGDKVPFYVRVNTTRQAVGGGFFDIRVVGDPA